MRESAAPTTTPWAHRRFSASPSSGSPPLGDPLEFWMYLIVALALPFGVGFWALVDRRRSANLVLIVMHLAVAVMVYRMLVIWG